MSPCLDIDLFLQVIEIVPCRMNIRMSFLIYAPPRWIFKTLVVRKSFMSCSLRGLPVPLVLMPEAQGRLELWAPYIPLLGEMCRTLAYAPSVAAQSAPGTQKSDQPPDLPSLDTILRRSACSASILPARDAVGTLPCSVASRPQGVWKPCSWWA